MDVKYELPGTIEVRLDIADLSSMQERGFCVERNGFSSTDSKTWVHLKDTGKDGTSYPNDNDAMIENGGDLHIHLSRGFMPPLTIERPSIEGSADVIEHYLGKSGIILVVT